MKILASIFSVLLFLMCSNTTKAQFLKKLEEKVVNIAEKAVERKAEQKTESAINKALDKGTDAKTYKGNRTNKYKKNKKAKNDSKTETVLVKEEEQ